MELNPLLSTTTIVDRTGRRIGTYLVDRSKDSLDQENKQKQEKHQPRYEEAVVMHGSTDLVSRNAEIDVEPDPLTGVAILNVKA